jgi:hypothetical protein
MDWLISSGLDSEPLLLEGLLRRGFLAFRDEQGLWLGSGSHIMDLRVLGWVEGIEVVAVTGREDRIARILLRPNSSALEITAEIVGLGENHAGKSVGSYTGCGPAHYLSNSWSRYRNMVWGAKRAVCPAKSRGESPVYDALDVGVALLVKVLPLARVATASCCDGHGVGPADVSFYYPWDAPWCEAVFAVLGDATPHSVWSWDDETLRIAPLGGYGDTEVLGMLNDIQRCSRRLLNQDIIDSVGRARERTIKVFTGWHCPLPCEVFALEARQGLSMELARIG